MELTVDIFSQFDKKWALLTSGTKDKFNSMTISWGGAGTLWSKPVVTAYVRTSRYTHDFMNMAKVIGINYLILWMKMNTSQSAFTLKI